MAGVPALRSRRGLPHAFACHLHCIKRALFVMFAALQACLGGPLNNCDIKYTGPLCGVCATRNFHDNKVI
jgi:hypothetical protein